MADPPLKAADTPAEASADPERDHRLRALVDEYPGVILWTAGDGTIHDLAGDAALFGRPLVALRGARLPDLLPASAALTWSNAARRPDDANSFEIQLEDGTERWLEAHVLRGAKDELITLLHAIDERKALEFRLRASEERFRRLSSAAPVGIYRTDLEGRILDVNDRYCEIFQVERADALRPDFMQRITYPADLPRVADGWRRVLTSGGQITPLEPARYLTPSGTLGWVSTRIAPIRDRTGRVEGFIGTVWDVTELKHAEAAKRELERRVQQAQKLEGLGLLAGGIAHDFNNLLVAILGGADLALRTLGSDDKAPDESLEADPNERRPSDTLRSQLAQIKGSALRAADLTRQMLAYAGKSNLVFEAIDVKELVEEIRHLLDVSLPKNAELRLHLQSARVEGDRSQLVQMVVNLVTNAAEALDGRPGRVDLRSGTVHLESSDIDSLQLSQPLNPGRYTFLDVVDTGRGMDRETRAKIFDPFFSTKFRGRGLGLAAVLGIVRGHRGTLAVDSEPGRGAHFRVLLPPLAGPAVRPVREETRMLDWKGQGTVLVVDDEAPVRMIAELMLQQLGFDVITAKDGIDGVQTFKEHNEIDVVLMDLTMPRMGGERAFLEMRRIRPDAKIILTSGYDEAEAAAKVRDEGVAGFLQKPFELADLGARLRTALGEAH
ncbi:MAG: response regulator [Acidobacteriota bacterium]